MHRMIAIVMAAVCAVAALAGCRSNPERRQAVGNVLSAAWEAGGRAYCAERIDRLVAEGRLTETEAARLKAVGLASLEALKREIARLDGQARPEVCPPVPSEGGSPAGKAMP